MSEISDLESMALALDEARAAGAAGDIPVGAVGLVGGQLIARAGNRRERDQDPTAHAELLVLRAVAEALGSWHLEELVLVVTLEPCAMCAGALLNARVGRLVIGAMDEKAGAVGSRYNLLADPRLNHEPQISTGFLAEESAALLRDFFAARRR